MTKREKNMNYRMLILGLGLILILAMDACQESEPTEPIEAAFKVHGRDNGNAGNVTDIEVNYSQFGLDLIDSYRAFVVKSQKKEEHDLDYLLSLPSERLLNLAVNDVLPSRGKRLPISMLDTDGDIVITGEPYRVAVISLPKDPSVYLPTLAYSEDDIILERNHVISNFTIQLELGGGDLAINTKTEMVMASYDVIKDLGPDFPSSSEILAIDEDGEISGSGEIFSHLGGVDFDSEGAFYISNTIEGHIIKYDVDGSKETLPIIGVELEEPTGIFINEDDEIYVADRKSGRIIHIDNNLISRDYTFVGEGVLGLTGDEEGNLYASINQEEGEIVKIDTERKVSVLAQIPTFVRANYLLPFISWLGHLEYHENLLYVAGTSTNQIYNVSMEGELSVYAGTGERQLPHGDIKTAHFNRPIGLAFNADGSKLFISGCEDTTPQHTQASFPSRVYVVDLVD